MSKEFVEGITWDEHHLKKEGNIRPEFYKLGASMWRVAAVVMINPALSVYANPWVVHSAIEGTSKEAREVAQYLCDLANVRRTV